MIEQRQAEDYIWKNLSERDSTLYILKYYEEKLRKVYQEIRGL